jgi:hypothetical protein
MGPSNSSEESLHNVLCLLDTSSAKVHTELVPAINKMVNPVATDPNQRDRGSVQ